MRRTYQAIPAWVPLARFLLSVPRNKKVRLCDPTIKTGAIEKYFIMGLTITVYVAVPGSISDGMKDTLCKFIVICYICFDNLLDRVALSPTREGNLLCGAHQCRIPLCKRSRKASS